MGVMPFLAACHACVLMLYYIVTIVCYVCSFEWQIKFSLARSVVRYVFIDHRSDTVCHDFVHQHLCR